MYITLGPGGRTTWDSLRGMQREVRRHCARRSGGSGAIQATQPRRSPYLHRCTSHDHADDARRTWPGLDLRPSGEEGDSSPAPLSRLRSAGASRKVIPGNDVADGWAKQAASEPDDTDGVE